MLSHKGETKAQKASKNKDGQPSLMLRAWRLLKSKLSNFRIFYLGRLVRTFRTPRIPVNPDGKVLIHIGCGEFNDPRYINIDKRKLEHIHFVGSAEGLSSIPLNCADLIYMSHILEHISHLKLKGVLVSLRQRLKNGGILRISVPDFDKMIEIYKETEAIESIIPPLMGGQDYPENYHTSVFNFEYLSKLLTEAGFRSVREWDPANAEYHDFEDWSRIPFCVGNRQYSISLNLEAVK